MKARVLFGVFGFIFVLLALYVFPPIVLEAVVAALCVIATCEVLGSTKLVHNRLELLLAMLVSLGLAVGHFTVLPLDLTDVMQGLVLVMLVGSFAIELKFHDSMKVSQVAWGFFGALLVPYLLLSLLRIFQMNYHHGPFIVLLPLLAAWGADTCALFAGMFFGRHKLAPVVSPKKTVEGAVGGVIGGAVLVLIAALIIGALAQKSRMCFAGSIRDVILMKNFDLLSIIAALFAVMAVYNLTAGNFHLGFSGQPIAHSQHLWNILGMYVVGFAAVLAGGCPLRQLILAGQGSSDSAVTFLGMLLGAAAAHNFGLAGAAAKAATETEAAVPGGPSAAGKIAVIVCIVVLFVIAGTNLRRKKAAR